ncbi:MAG: hypothetical protein JNG89_08870 [Planctomycetaceae bacterium]|nr:hypothetical protein [Planctomycetaceae bacterium]
MFRNEIVVILGGAILRAWGLWLPFMVLVLLWTDSAYHHRLLVYRMEGREFWAASEAGVCGASMYVPYHGQYELGWHYRCDSTHWDHIRSDARIARFIPWFNFRWAGVSGVFGVARGYTLAVPYWFLMLLSASFWVFARLVYWAVERGRRFFRVQLASGARTA